MTILTWYDGAKTVRDAILLQTSDRKFQIMPEDLPYTAMEQGKENVEEINTICNMQEDSKMARSRNNFLTWGLGRFILPLLPPFRMVENYFFEVNQNEFQKSIWLLKFDAPPKKKK